MMCKTKESIYYQLSIFSLYKNLYKYISELPNCFYIVEKYRYTCDTIQKLKKFPYIDSDEANLSHWGFYGQAFLIEDKLIFSFAGTILDGIESIGDFTSSAYIMLGWKPVQLQYAQKFRDFAEKIFNGSYKKEIATGMSLGGALAELLHINKQFSKVYSIDGLATGHFTTNSQKDSDIVFIYLAHNFINLVGEQRAGYKIQIKDPNFQDFDQPILKFIDTCFLWSTNFASHDPQTLGTGKITEENVEIIGNTTELNATEVVTNFCFNIYA